MNKTMKKALLVAILFVTMLLIKSTNVFASGYVRSSEEAFNKFSNIKDGQTYNLFVGEKMYAVTSTDITWFLKPDIKVDNPKIVKIENKKELKAVKVGKTNVTVTVQYNNEVATKKYTINVKKPKKVDTKLESKINDITKITQNTNAKNQILLANGELWNAKDKTFKITKKETGNVAKFVYSSVYHSSAMVDAILKKDGTLTIKNSTTKAKKISNVKDILGYGYLTEKGKFYIYIADDDGKLTTKQRLTGVKNVLSNYVFTKKGKTYGISGKKIADFEAVQADPFSSCASGLLLDKKGTLYYYYYDYGYDYQDGTSRKVRKAQYVIEKEATNVKRILEEYGKYETKKGKVKKSKHYDTSYMENVDKSILKSVWLTAGNKVILKTNNKAYLNGTYLMSKVDDIYFVNGTKAKSALLVRKDGSIWRVDLGGKELLTKVRSGKIENKKISKPTKLSATQKGKTKAKIKWSKVEGASQYTIYRATSKNGKYKKVGTSKSASYTDSGLKKGSTYYYKVVANHSNESFNSSRSSAIKIKLSK